MQWSKHGSCVFIIRHTCLLPQACLVFERLQLMTVRTQEVLPNGWKVFTREQLILCNTADLLLRNPSKKHFQLTVLTRPFSTFQSITINRRKSQFLLIYFITCNSSGIYIFNSAQGSLVITITLYQIFFESLLSFITNERAFEWTSYTFIFVTFLGLILGNAIYERNQRFVIELLSFDFWIVSVVVDMTVIC